MFQKICFVLVKQTSKKTRVFFSQRIVLIGKIEFTWPVSTRTSSYWNQNLKDSSMYLIDAI